MAADSWETWDREDLNEQQYQLFRDFEQWADEIEIPPNFHERLMEIIRKPLDEDTSLGPPTEQLDDDQWVPLLALLAMGTKHEYRTCRNTDCKYQVTSLDKYCPNCGIELPFGIPDFQYQPTGWFDKIFGPSLDNPEKCWGWKWYLNWKWYHWILACSCLLLRNKCKVDDQKSEYDQKYSRYSDFCFIKDEETIKERLRDIDAQEEKFERELATIPYERSKRILRQELSRIPELRWRYQNLLCAIELRRWHNKALPVYEHALNLVESEYDSRIARSKDIIEEGESIRHRWQETYPSDLEVFKRLDEALDTCERFHEELRQLRVKAMAGQIRQLQESLARLDLNVEEIKPFSVLGELTLGMEAADREYHRMLLEPVRDVSSQ